MPIEDPDPSLLNVKELQKTLLASARAAGGTAVTSGKWLTEWVVDNAPRIPVRDARTLSLHHGGLVGDELATELIDTASKGTAAVGAAVGAMAGAHTMMPPLWLALPFELVVETAAVAVLELKLTAELHEVYGRGIQGRARDRGLLIVKAWAERRGITAANLQSGGISTKAVRDEVIRQARRRLIRRAGRNLSSMVPMFVGAAAGAVANRRATRDFGKTMANDLRT